MQGVIANENLVKIKEKSHTSRMQLEIFDRIVQFPFYTALRCICAYTRLSLYFFIDSSSVFIVIFFSPLLSIFYLFIYFIMPYWQSTFFLHIHTHTHHILVTT